MRTRDITATICRRLFPILTNSWTAVWLTAKNSEDGVVERSNQFLPGLLRVTACSLFGGLVGYSIGFLGPEIIGAGQSDNLLFALFVMFPLGLVGGVGFGLIRELRDL